jgi:hypothetical protein
MYLIYNVHLVGILQRYSVYKNGRSGKNLKKKRLIHDFSDNTHIQYTSIKWYKYVQGLKH